MNRLLKAGVLALGIHGLLLGLNIKWPEKISFERSKTKTLSMTLISIPVKASPKPPIQNQPPILKQPAMIKKPKKNLNPKRILKTPRKKTVRHPVQTKEKKVIKKKPEKTIERYETSERSEISERQDILSEPEQTSPQARLNEQNATAPIPVRTLREAKPLYRSNPSPKYPRIARVRGYQGTVQLDVLVDKNGRVRDLKIFQSSGYPQLDRAAKSAVKRWLFKPGMIGEDKVEMWVRVPIRFELRE